MYAVSYFCIFTVTFSICSGYVPIIMVENDNQVPVNEPRVVQPSLLSAMNQRRSPQDMAPHQNVQENTQNQKISSVIQNPNQAQYQNNQHNQNYQEPNLNNQAYSQNLQDPAQNVENQSNNQVYMENNQARHIKQDQRFAENLKPAPNRENQALNQDNSARIENSQNQEFSHGANPSPVLKQGNQALNIENLARDAIHLAPQRSNQNLDPNQSQIQIGKQSNNPVEQKNRGITFKSQGPGTGTNHNAALKPRNQAQNIANPAQNQNNLVSSQNQPNPNPNRGNPVQIIENLAQNIDKLAHNIENLAQNQGDLAPNRKQNQSKTDQIPIQNHNNKRLEQNRRNGFGGQSLGINPNPALNQSNQAQDMKNPAQNQDNLAPKPSIQNQNRSQPAEIHNQNQNNLNQTQLKTRRNLGNWYKRFEIMQRADAADYRPKEALRKPRYESELDDDAEDNHDMDDILDHIGKIVSEFTKTKKLPSQVVYRAQQDFDIRPSIIKFRSSDQPSLKLDFTTNTLMKFLESFLASPTARRYADSLGEQAASIFRSLQHYEPRPEI